jgi:hypothetical protein
MTLPGTNMDLHLAAGFVVVTGLILCLLALLLYGIWDLYMQAKGRMRGVTASNWIGRFVHTWPLAVFCAGLALGILAGHFLWTQTIRVPWVNP